MSNTKKLLSVVGLIIVVCVIVQYSSEWLYSDEFMFLGMTPQEFCRVNNISNGQVYGNCIHYRKNAVSIVIGLDNDQKINYVCYKMIGGWDSIHQTIFDDALSSMIKYEKEGRIRNIWNKMSPINHFYFECEFIYAADDVGSIIQVRKLNEGLYAMDFHYFEK